MKNNITIFLLCRAVSQIGDDMQDTVIPILILEMTKSSKSFASFIGFQDLFMLLVVIFVGYITDIYDRKKNMVICDFINGSITLFFLIFFKKNFYYILIFQLSQMFFSNISNFSLVVMVKPAFGCIEINTLPNCGGTLSCPPQVITFLAFGYAFLTRYS